VLRYNAPNDAYKMLSSFIDAAIIYDLNDDVVNTNIAICKQQKIKLPDAIIAATALIYDLSLINRNTKDFENIYGLQIVNPWNL
jgi:predicted nucleic acid-binding protein